MFCGFAACSVILTFLSWFKFNMTGGEWGLDPLQNQVLEEKVQVYYNAKLDNTQRGYTFDAKRKDVKQEDQEGILKGDLMFMREIIHSYVIKEEHASSLQTEADD